jgi:acetyltransferase-like isoleucine patch superfamily enzyme
VTKIASTALIYPNVILGDNVLVEDYCIVGLPFKGMKDESTIIGDHSIIRAGTYIYAGNHIGKHFQTGNKANIRELNQIGDHVSIGTSSVIEHHVEIGNWVRIHSQVFIPEYCLLEEKCWIGPNVVLTNATYPKHPTIKQNLQGVRLRRNSKIGANTTILPGVEVGENSLIGAGSMVTKDIKCNLIVAGNPAKKIRDIDYI